MNFQHIVVIGAGIVGASSAIWLRSAWFEVTLLDEGRPEMGTLYGNGRILANSSVVTGPGLVCKIPPYLADPNFLFFMRWSYVPKLLPWLIKYLSFANESDMLRIRQGLITIVGDRLEQHKALTVQTNATKWVQSSNYSFAYADRVAFNADAFGWQLRKGVGFIPDLIEGRAVQEEEPILELGTQLLAVLEGHCFILNPGAYVKDLISVLKELSGCIAIKPLCSRAFGQNR